MELEQLVTDVADAVLHTDKSAPPFRGFQRGVGPYGEPQLVAQIAAYLNTLPEYHGSARTKRTPDLLIPNEWAVEFKITRPFGDNGKEAENWSVNLLHPYPGNVSSIGDCYKLCRLTVFERKAVIVIGYEHSPAKIDLSPLIVSFELITKHVANVDLSARVETFRAPLIHPVHQSVRVFAWQVL